MIDNVWEVIPGSVEWHRRHDGILSLYVGPRGKAHDGVAHFPSEFVHRWTIWLFGTLLGEGACPTPQAAMSAAEQEAERVLYRIREHVKTMDIRNARAVTTTATHNPPHHVRETRYPELGFRKITDTVWRIVDRSTDAEVGPVYVSRSELLGDLTRYAREFGCA